MLTRGGARVQGASGAPSPQPNGQRAAARSGGEEGRRAGMPAMVCSALGRSTHIDPVPSNVPLRCSPAPSLSFAVPILFGIPLLNPVVHRCTTTASLSENPERWGLTPQKHDALSSQPLPTPVASPLAFPEVIPQHAAGLCAALASVFAKLAFSDLAEADAQVQPLLCLEDHGV